MTDISQIMSKDSFTVKDLKDECKKRGIKGYSKLNKHQLIDKILFSVQSETDKFELKKEQNIMDKKNSKKESFLHYDVEFYYFGLPIREIKIIPKHEKNTNFEKIKDALETEINSKKKYELGDIITTIDWIFKNEKDYAIDTNCYGIICKDDSRKKIIPLDKFMTKNNSFIIEHPYLKNINFDNVIKTIHSKDYLEPFDSPLRVLAELNAKLNDKQSIFDQIQSMFDNGCPDIILSNNEVLEIDY